MMPGLFFPALMLSLTIFNPFLEEGKDESCCIAGNKKTVVAVNELLYQRLSEADLLSDSISIIHY
ncbi:MAG: hypothetical protein JXK95_10255 [Bacteroidales bacterium]|nr:hypothetical protein [Bacteroidales bacterium]